MDEAHMSRDVFHENDEILSSEFVDEAAAGETDRRRRVAKSNPAPVFVGTNSVQIPFLL